MSTFIGGNINTTAGATVITVTHGITILTGDVIIATVNANAAPIITDNNGAFPFVDDFNTSYSSAVMSVFSRVAGASEPSSYSFALSSSQRCSLIVRVYRGVDNGGIYDVAPLLANFSEGENTNPSATSITTLTDNAKVVCAIGNDSTSNVSWSAYTNSFINEVEAGGNRNASTSVDKDQVTAGAVGVTSATQSIVNTSTDWYAMQFALKEEAATGPTITDINSGSCYPGQTLTPFTGTAFGADGGQLASVLGTAQTAETNTATTGTFTVVQGGDKYGSVSYIFTDTLAAASAPFSVNLIANPATKQYIDAVDPITGLVGGFITSVFYGTTAITGDQWESDLLTSAGNAITQQADGEFTIAGPVESESFNVRLRDSTDNTWSSEVIQLVNGVIPPSGEGVEFRTVSFNTVGFNQVTF